MNGYEEEAAEPIEVAAARLDELVLAFEGHPDEQVRRDVFTLLDRVDALHRTALTELALTLRETDAGGALARAMAVRSVCLLMELYGLIPGEDPVPLEAALEEVRPYLLQYRMAVRLIGVRDGVVRLRLTGAAEHGGSVPEQAREAIESVLTEHFPALVRVEIEGATPPPRDNLIPLTLIDAPSRPPAREWRVAGAVADMPAGFLTRAIIGEHWLALCNVDGTLYALRDVCPGSSAPLTLGELVGPELRCVWHGCRFDVPSGQRTVGDGPALQRIPVRVTDGSVFVELPVTPVASVATEK